MARESNLTSRQKAFVAAYLGSARRDPVVAAIMAGMQVTREQARALVEHPGIRAELERRSVEAIVVDGQLVDVEQRSLRQTDGVRKGRRKLRSVPKVLRPGDLKTSQTHDVVPGRALKGDRLPHPRVLTEDGLEAGSLAETTRRLDRAAGGRSGLKGVKGSSPKLIKHLADRFDATGDDYVAVPTPEGSLTVATPVKTRFELKLWLSQVVDGRLPLPVERPGDEPTWVPVHDVGVRMQAAGLLGKALGMFSERVILDEYQRDNAAPGSETEELQRQIQETIEELKRLKGAG